MSTSWPFHEVIGRDFRTDVEERVLGNPEFDQLGLGLHFGLAEGAALRLGDILRLGRAGAELDGGIAVRLASRRLTTWTPSSWRTVTGT
jgi:hypothetical protein